MGRKCKKLREALVSLRFTHLELLKKNEQGQDLIEYALLMGFMVIAVYAILPNDMMPAVSFIFSKVLERLAALGGA